MEEATMLVSIGWRSRRCVGGHKDKIIGIKIRELQRFIELGDNLQMNSRKLRNKKCNFYNRGFCNKRMQCSVSSFIHWGCAATC
jgi:hypothetical protein